MSGGDSVGLKLGLWARVLKPVDVGYYKADPSNITLGIYKALYARVIQYIR